VFPVSDMSVSVKRNGKGKGNWDLYSAFVVIHSRRSGTDHTVLSYPPLPRKRSPDGATSGSGSRHLIAAYYSFLDPGRMKD